MLSCWVLHWCGCAVPCSKLVCRLPTQCVGRAGSPLLANSHVHRRTSGHAVASDLKWVKGCDFHHWVRGDYTARERGWWGLELLPEQKLRGSEEFPPLPYLVSPGPPYSSAGSPAGISPLLYLSCCAGITCVSRAVLQLWSLSLIQDWSKPGQLHSNPGWSRIAAVWHRMELNMLLLANTRNTSSGERTAKCQIVKYIPVKLPETQNVLFGIFHGWLTLWKSVNRNICLVLFCCCEHLLWSGCMTWVSLCPL